MIYNGELATPATATLYTVPSPTPGSPGSGNLVTVNFFRIVNESATAKTFTIYLNVNGVNRAITPVGKVLTSGTAYDDIPVFQLAPGNIIAGVANGAGVSWNINVV